MIIRTPEYDQFHRELIANENLSHDEALRIYEALHREAVALGAIRSDDIIEGLEVDLRIARAINGLTS